MNLEAWLAIIDLGSSLVWFHRKSLQYPSILQNLRRDEEGTLVEQLGIVFENFNLDIIRSIIQFLALKSKNIEYIENMANLKNVDLLRGDFLYTSTIIWTLLEANNGLDIATCLHYVT